MNHTQTRQQNHPQYLNRVSVAKSCLKWSHMTRVSVDCCFPQSYFIISYDCYRDVHLTFFMKRLLLYLEACLYGYKVSSFLEDCLSSSLFIVLVKYFCNLIVLSPLNETVHAFYVTGCMSVFVKLEIWSNSTVSWYTVCFIMQWMPPVSKLSHTLFVRLSL